MYNHCIILTRCKKKNNNFDKNYERCPLRVSVLVKKYLLNTEKNERLQEDV